MTQKENPTPENLDNLPEENAGGGPEEEGRLQQKRRAEMASKWMEGSGPDADIVISSRVRLARNVQKLPFPPLATDSQREKVFQLAEKVVQKGKGAGNPEMQLLNISALRPVSRQVLVEKKLNSQQ